MSRHIPFADLHAQYLSIQKDIDLAIASVIRDTAFIGGSYVKRFEQEFAKHQPIKHCISCANGTDSIEILLKASGVGPGDEVIVPAISWISTSEAVTAIGATPVFVDIEPSYYTLDVGLIPRAITPRTKAIIPVHLYGHPADLPGIMNIAQEHKLIVIEDCAQAHDASINGKKIGQWGHAASYSFYPGKNLGAYGDAGCMTTNDDAIAVTARQIANHGQLKKHEHLIEGRNSRLDGLHAAILSAKLPYLNDWTARRIGHAGLYSRLLQNSRAQLPSTRPGSIHVFHLYVVQVDNRAAVAEHLRQQGIETSVHYPTALPFLPAYRRFKHAVTDFPVAARCQDRVLSLPLYPEMQEEDIAFVTEQLIAATSRS